LRRKYLRSGDLSSRVGGVEVGIVEIGGGGLRSRVGRVGNGGVFVGRAEILGMGGEEQGFEE